MAERVVVAMSGGVDSSVAASMMVEAGYDVVGIALKLWSYAKKDEDNLGSCCSPDDLYDARQVAYALDIPFYVSNAQESFQTEVVDRFTEDYLKGLTPNPCVRCNERVKFGRMLHLAKGLGANILVTGHYARIETNIGDDGATAYELFKGTDPKKDQSYFLFNLDQTQLSRLRFPLGGMTKDEVRAYAAARDLPTASKHESMEICFVGNNRYAEFVEGRVPAAALPKPGPLMHIDGRALGQHKGIHRYTIGQRKGLGLPGGFKEALYVIDIRGNRVVVGPDTALWRQGLMAKNMSWISGASPGPDEEFSARVRHHGSDVPARLVKVENGRSYIKLMSAHRAISPGQALVLSQGDKIIGGGWIVGPWDAPMSNSAPQIDASNSEKQVG